MALTIKNHRGRVDTTPSVSGTPSRVISGPPASAAAMYRGMYVLQSGTVGAGDFRWLEDQATPGTPSPTTYTYLPDLTS